MRLTSYFAPTVEQAIERARIELGPDAMLLNSRRVTSGGPASALGDFEVVFGITGETLQRKPALPIANPASTANSNGRASLSTNSVPPGEPPSAHAKPVQPSTAVKRSKASHGKKAQPLAHDHSKPAGKTELSAVADQLAELRKEIQAVQTSLRNNRQYANRDANILDPSHLEAHQELTAFDFSEGGARSLLEAALQTQAAFDTDMPAPRLESTIVDEINSRYRVSAHVGAAADGMKSSDRLVLMLIGPPGVGKTTTLVKLAIRLGIERRLPVQLLSLDTMRVGGSEQLAEYARIIGADFRAVYNTAALGEALEECSHRKLVFIDTPGYAAAEIAEAGETASFLRHHPEIERQLVLPASLRASALVRFSERFSVFAPTKLLFTHLDEVETFGPLLEHAMNTNLPISYLANGQSIPNDIEEASKSRLTAGLFASQAVDSHVIPSHVLASGQAASISAA